MMSPTKLRIMAVVLVAALAVVAGTRWIAAAEVPKLPGSDIIPAGRLADWTPGVTVGVPGGIPTDRKNLIDVTKDPYKADNTGAKDASKAVAAAVAAAVKGDVVYLPAGTYRIEGGIGVGFQKSGITVRGAGMDKTTLNMIGNAGVFIGTGENYDWPKDKCKITAGLTKGSTQITVEDATPFAVGKMIKIGFEDDPSIPVLSVAGFAGMRRQQLMITAKNGNTLTVTPPLYHDYNGAGIKVAQLQTTSVGLEDMTIDSSNAKNWIIVKVDNCYGSWIKNVRTRKATNYQIALFDCLFFEIRGCYLDDLVHSGSNGAGLLMNTVTASLIENNIIYKAFPLIEVNHGSAGNVIAYNYLEDSGPGCAIDSNHGPHNNFNLYEGNISPNLQADGYFGSASDDTVFRNWFHGKRAATANPSWCMSLNRFTRNYSLVGNILAGPASMGNPNMGNGAFEGTAQLTAGKSWADWNPKSGSTVKGVLTERSTDTAGKITLSSGSLRQGQSPMLTGPGGTWCMVEKVEGNVVSVETWRWQTKLPPLNTEFSIFPGPGGFQELDLDVKATTLLKDNYYSNISGVPAEESLGNATLPKSLYLKEKPAWFGDLAWPPFGPDVDFQKNKIPAQVLFEESTKTK